MRGRTMASTAEDTHIKGIRSGKQPTGADIDGTGFHAQDVLREDDVWLGDFLVQPVLDHGLCAGEGFLCGLENADESPAPGMFRGVQEFGCGEEGRDVGVVAAGVHDGGFGGRGITVAVGGFLAGVGQAGLLFYGEGVHVGAEEDGRPFAVLEHACESMAADASVDLEVEALKALGGAGGGVYLLAG